MKTPDLHRRTMLIRTLFLGIGLSLTALSALRADDPRGNIIAQSEDNTSVYQIVSVIEKEAGWNELDKVDKSTGKKQIIFADEVIMTNSRNSGDGVIPPPNQKELASQYAKYLISQAGGLNGYQREMNKLPKFHIPAPTGLLGAALQEAGIELPEVNGPNLNKITPAQPTQRQEKQKSMEW